MERDRRIDSLRVVAILLVVAGHAIIRSYAGHPERAPLGWAAAFGIIAAINVPLLMFLSGWVSRPRRGVRWIGDRALRLLVPFLASCVVQAWLLGSSGWWRTFVSFVLHPSTTDSLWFLPSLFLCSVAFGLLGGSELLLAAVAVVLVFYTPPVPLFDVAKASTMFPLFVAGYFARRAEADPRPLAMLAPLLVATSWAVPGIGLQWTRPGWYAVWARLAAGVPLLLVAAPLRIVHYATMLSLVAVAFWFAGFGRRAWLPRLSVAARDLAARAEDALRPGWDWMGRNTLGVYLGHIYFLGWHVGTGSVAVVTTFATALAGGAALAWLAGRSRWTSGLFLGTGFAPLAPPRLPAPSEEPQAGIAD